MNKEIKKEQSFLGLFYAPICWGDLRPILEIWRTHLKEPNRTRKFMDWDNLEFVFDDKFKKQNLYYQLLDKSLELYKNYNIMETK